jgi:glycosyltransferase involved in cell wall biosynthesis
MDKSPEMTENYKISVVIPVYNERDYIARVVERVVRSGIADEVVIIDDASTDGTRDILRHMEKGWDEDTTALKVLCQERNSGKGAALRKGFENLSGDIVIIQDADFEYDPGDYPVLIKPILDGRADVVYGSRFLGGPHRVIFFWHMVGNKLLTLLSNMFTNLNLTDMETGYKAFRADVIRNITLRSDRFGFEPEFTAKVAKKGYRIYETPISYAGRTYGEGKKIGWRDGVTALWHIVRFNVFP